MEAATDAASGFSVKVAVVPASPPATDVRDQKSCES